MVSPLPCLNATTCGIPDARDEACTGCHPHISLQVARPRRAVEDSGRGTGAVCFFRKKGKKEPAMFVRRRGWEMAGEGFLFSGMSRIPVVDGEVTGDASPKQNTPGSPTTSRGIAGDGWLKR